MPLSFQNFPISFNQGLDTKSDRKQVIPGKLLDLRNGVFTNYGAINKRYGYNQLSPNIEAGAAITSGQALATYRNELLQFGGNRLYSRLNATSKWIDRGQVVSLIENTTPIIANGYQQLNPDTALNGGLQIFAWEDSRNGVRYSLLDTATGAFLTSDELVSSTGSAPKTIALANTLFVFFVDGASIKYRQLNITTPTHFATEQVATSNLNASHTLYDVCLNGTKLFLSFANSAAGSSVLTIDANFNLSAEVATSGAPTACLTCWADINQNVWTAYDDGSEVQAYILSFTLSSVLTPTTVESTGATISTLTGIETTPGTSTLYYELAASPTLNTLVRTNTLTLGGTAGTPSVFCRSVGLGSKAFSYNGHSYVNVAYQSALQPKYLTLDSGANVVAKIAPGVGGGLRTNNTLPQVDSSTPGVVVFAMSQKGRLLSALNTIFSLLGVIGVSLNFSSNDPYLTTELGDSLFVSGGIVQAYDGVSFTEANFHFYPDGDGIALDGYASGGLLGTGSYQYLFTYEWTDNNGQIHRSTTSEIQTIVFASGTTNSVQMQIPTLRITAKQARSPVRVCVYRTEADLSTFFRVSSVISPLFNDPTVDAVFFTDTLADTDIESSERIYTDGGVLDSDAPPAAAAITTYRNRVWLAGLADDKLTLWYSQLFTPGEPVEFSDFLTITCDGRGGGITALAAMDDSLIVFKTGALFRIIGDGPSNTGDLPDYGNPVLITSDVGCTNPNSVSTTPQGIVFQSAKGLMLLDRGFNIQYIGAQVERYNSLLITSSTTLPDQNLVVFTTNTDTALVYDYFFQQWSTFTNHNAADARLWNGVFVFLASNGTVSQQDKTKFTDGSSFVPLYLRTSYLYLAGLQGFQRIKRLAILGEFKGPHTLLVQTSYDFNPAFSNQYSVNADAVFGSSTWGSDATWGAGSPWGGLYSPYHFIVHLQRQLCQSLSITISDSQSSNYNEGYSISGITLEVGVKQGLNKTPAINKTG